ncbi:hypothetical protein QBC36DRAFT_346023 [Triangularia setosa]|uniref:Heterokaryon incompatibility domain-containing protein n=1 Tax=Triangularia setosa TaxID=2587417 RepID=A0AAN7A673_9PEZI|nr:hypothetical protein QBC36DRAFT_346023 [Podospora setosa]
MSSFKQVISLIELPKIFQEAVQVPRRFNIEYIWDWKRESVLMASIYGNSHLNIAATASRDGRGGCFRPRRTTALHPVKMIIHSRDFYPQAFEKAPLNTRAWVLQERLLSPGLTAIERYPDGIGGLFPSPRFLRNRLDSLLQTALLPGQELFHTWKPIVGAYSSCALTKPSDKLIALHGIASKIKDVFKANYVADLFSTNLES